MSTLPTPEVSVVVCAHNAEKTLLHQLDALAGQVDAPVFEVIIVDNRSSDATRAVAERWCEQSMGSVSMATIIAAHEKASIPYARNAGGRACRGDVIAYCDADDVVAPDWVSVMAREAREGMVQGALIGVKEDGSHDAAVSRTKLRRTPYLPFATTNNFAFPRRMFFEVGGFDESLPPYGAEDLEFSWRGQEHGYELRFVPGAVVRYAITPPRKALGKEFSVARAHVAVMMRHPEAARLCALHSVSLPAAIRDLLLLPWRLVRPGERTRSRAVKLAVQGLGTLSGYWTYVLWRTPPITPCRD